MASLSSRFKPLLAERKQQHLFRQRPLATSAQQAAMQINGIQCINFSSNDYLGLANNANIKQAVINALQTEQTSYGAGAAHLVTGHHLEHHIAEDELADWLDLESALLFSTGYMANLAIHQALLQTDDIILADKLNHASLIDGAKLCGATLKRYPHLDMAALERRLQQAQTDNAQVMIVTDGVFSMDGDIAPLKTMQAMAQKYGAWLMVDDAHGLGTLGKNGKGSFEHFDIEPDENTILMGTLGKAFGVSGAFVAGSQVLIQALIQYARPYIYTTAMPQTNAVAIRAALKEVKAAKASRETLNANITQFKQGAKKIGLELWPSNTAIQPIMLGKSETALAWSETLKQQGFWVTAIRPPTVPKNQARLRVTLSAGHSPEQINALLTALQDLVKTLQD